MFSFVLQQLIHRVTKIKKQPQATSIDRPESRNRKHNLFCLYFTELIKRTIINLIILFRVTPKHKCIYLKDLFIHTISKYLKEYQHYFYKTKKTIFKRLYNPKKAYKLISKYELSCLNRTCCHAFI